jgi:hypothetical protein
MHLYHQLHLRVLPIILGATVLEIAWFAMLGINLFYQFWLHTDLIGHLGRSNGYATRTWHDRLQQLLEVK